MHKDFRLVLHEILLSLLRKFHHATKSCHFVDKVQLILSCILTHLWKYIVEDMDAFLSYGHLEELLF